MAAEPQDETEAERFARFFGDGSTEPAALPPPPPPPPPAPAPAAPGLEAASPAAAYLRELVAELLAASETRGERSTALLACCAAGAFVAQLPRAAAAFDFAAPPLGASATLLASRGARLEPLGPDHDAYDGDDPPPPLGCGWAHLVGRPWPALARPARARRYGVDVARGVVVAATQTSSGALAQADALRHLAAICDAVDALARCGVGLEAAAVVCWVDDEVGGTRARPLAHLVDYDPRPPAGAAAALPAALADGPQFRARLEPRA